ncbi:MAG: Type II secretion system protein E [Elusimicrobia bacterium ADurb.Bin231]|nr:MAG: Type II secretion system protein E [Elusimicrobia bacterium ADurb.Bin231]
MPIKPIDAKKKLGDILAEYGVITGEQLEKALVEQQHRGGPIGAVLVQLGYITEDVLVAFLGKQAGVPYVSLQEIGEISEDIIKLVPETVARHQTLIPITKKDNILTIAMANPLNVFATDDLRLITGCQIKAVIASETEIKNAIEKYYSAKGSIDDVVKELEHKGGKDDLEVVKEQDSGKDIIALEADGSDAPIVKIVNLLLSGAVKAKASDIHIEPYEKTLRVRYRIDGVLHEVSAPPKKTQSAIVSRIKIMSQLDIAEKRLPQDGRIKIKVMNKEIDLRVSVLPTAFGEKVCMRILDASSLCLDLAKLGFEPEALAVYQKNVEAPHGIILITGPTGSGKSTTLYSTLSKVNQPDVNISTMEDPVEYAMSGINQVQANPHIGLTFASGLKSFLRQDPDIIMVGEIRDRETAEIAINAALTGHLVFSTLHTNDAPGSLTRLNNMGIEPFLTTSTVIMVIAQRLVRVICRNCAEEYEVPVDALLSLGVTSEEIKDVKTVKLRRGRGCERCSNTGYKGRLAIYEVMELNEKMKELILERASSHIIKKAAIENGMLTLRKSAIRKVLAGTTTVEEMLRVVTLEAE